MAYKATEEELLDLERQYWQAIKDRDASTALRLTDEACIVAGAQGVRRIDKDEMSEMMKSAKYTLNDFRIDKNVEVKLLREDIAILAYKVHEDLTMDGKAIAFDAADTSVWVRRNGRWLCALHTESLSGDPLGRDRRPMGQQTPKKN